MSKRKLPRRIKILNTIYLVKYLDKPSDVDIHKRESLWGQIDFWTRTIRIYAKDRTDTDICTTILHEVFHGIAEELQISGMMGTGSEKAKAEEVEKSIQLLALGMASVLQDNHWLKIMSS